MAQAETLLTPREGDVLRLLGQDLSNAQIALALQIFSYPRQYFVGNLHNDIAFAFWRALGGSLPAMGLD